EKLIKYCIKKIFKITILFFIISVVTFLIVRIIPGDPVIAYLNTFNLPMTEDNISFIKKEMGFNYSLQKQYFLWIQNIFNKDLGKSFLTNADVYLTIKTSLIYTVELTAASLGWVVLLGFPFGVISSLYQNKISDKIIRIFSLFSISIPKFWLGFLMINIFSVQLKMFPIAGAYSRWSIILPSLTLSLSYIAYYIKIIRENMIYNFNQNYIKYAEIRDVKKIDLIFKYAFKNSLNPILTSLGVNIGSMLSGAAIVENIFAWPGLGRLIVEAIDGRDYPVIQGYILIVSIIFVVINNLADILCYYFDPRIRKDF
ncbi:MAG: ABC transporter permease, partial [Fusobacteriaceae bacterium]